MMEIDGYEVLGLGIYFEDLPVGRKFRTIGRTLTEADLVNFISVTGLTEVLFSNIEFLKNESDIKQRVVPGAMVYSFSEGLLTHATMQHTGFAFLNMELNVHAPTFVNDTIHVECEVVENRRSNSRPNRGLVRTMNRVVKQDGTLVLTYNPLRLSLIHIYMATMSFYDYRAMVEDTPVETFLAEFRDPDTRLISACLADRLGDGLSAVYSFYAPTLEKRSLGTHAILWLIERARALGLPYVYLGYWVPESRKMAYKARFRPSEVLISGTWRTLTDSDMDVTGGPVGESALVTEPAI